MAVLLAPVRGNSNEIGLVLVKRKDGNGGGLYALPGGYVEASDPSIEAAASREFREEVGSYCPVETIRIHSSYGTGDEIILFTLTDDVLSEELALAEFQPSDEVEAIAFAYEPVQLAFESHTRALCDYLNGRPTPQWNL